MARHFFLAARAPSDLQAIPQSRVYLDRKDGHGPEFCWGPVAGEYPERCALLAFCAVVSVPGKTGSWRLYRLSCVSNDPAVARRLFRALRRYALAEPRIAGPWYPPALRRLAAALADAHASAEGPLVDVTLPDGSTAQVRTGGMPLLAGDDATRALGYDYAPTGAECSADNDVPPQETETP